MHEDSEGVQRQACLDLFNLNTSADAKNGVRAGKAGAVERVVVVLRRHVNWVSVQEMACPTLYSMTYDNAANLIRATNAGAIEALISVMRTHATHRGMQMNAIKMLMNTTGYDCPWEYYDRAIYAGAVEALVAAMCGSLEIDNVQAVACRVLQNLTINNVENRIRAGNAGAIEAVVAAQRRHSSSKTVQEMACGCLSALTSGSGNAVNKTRAWNAGAVGAVVAALHNHLGRESVQISGSASTVYLEQRQCGEQCQGGKRGRRRGCFDFDAAARGLREVARGGVHCVGSPGQG